MKQIVVTYDDQFEFREAHYAHEAWSAIREAYHELNSTQRRIDSGRMDDGLNYIKEVLEAALSRIEE